MANQAQSVKKQEKDLMELEVRRKELEEKEKALLEKEEQIKSIEKSLIDKEEKIDETIEEIKAKEIKLNDRECDKESINTAEELKKDLTEIKIPIDPLNKKDKTVDVFINGYRWTIEKGKEVKVPKAVKELLVNAKYI